MCSICRAVEDSAQHRHHLGLARMWRKKGPEAPTAGVERDIWRSSGYRRPAGRKLDEGTRIKGRADGQDIGETKAPSGPAAGGADVTGKRRPAAGAGREKDGQKDSGP